jgi:hypothetical protein
LSKVSGGTDRHNPIKPAPKPRPQPARHVRLVSPPDGLATGVIRITVGKASTDYSVRAIPSQVGGAAFELVKLGLEAGGETYHVLLTGDTNHDSCTCKGSVAHGHCKHRDAIAALVAAGRLGGKGAAA